MAKNKQKINDEITAPELMVNIPEVDGLIKLTLTEALAKAKRA